MDRAALVMADFAGSALGMIQALGWFGSALVVASLALRRPVPFRAVNLTSGVVVLAFNLAIGLWSMVVLNVAVLAINTWQLRKLMPRARVLDPAPPEEGWYVRRRGDIDPNAASTRLVGS